MNFNKIYSDRDQLVFQNVLSGARVIHKNHRGFGVVLLNSEGQIVKCFSSKSRLLTFIRNKVGCSKADKQCRSALMLRRLGLLTPEIFGILRFSLGEPYESALVCEYLDNVQPLSSSIQKLSSEKRATILCDLASQMGLMAQNGVLIIDFHLGNVLMDSKSKIWWIDPELWFSARKVRQHFWARVERMHRRCNPGLLTESEWRFFCECLNHEVSTVCGSYHTNVDHG